MQRGMLGVTSSFFGVCMALETLRDRWLRHLHDSLIEMMGTRPFKRTRLLPATR